MPISSLRPHLLVTLVLACLASGCVLDRTGMSQPAARDRELLRTQERLAALESRLSNELGTTSQQLSDVRKDSEVNQRNLANSGALLDVVLAEVQSARGSIESMERRVTESESDQDRLQNNLEFQLQEIDRRLKAVEQMVGMVETPVVATSGTSADTYSRANAALSGGNAKLAAALLKDFAVRYPQAPEGEDAAFLYAEATFQDSQWKQAISAYQVMVDKYPTSPNLPRVLLQQGQCFANLGEKADAKEFWSTLIQIYPNAPEAKIAQEKLTTLGK